MLSLFWEMVQGIKMTYVVTDACVKCKYTECVEKCPVDCFHEGENMLVINPEVCIDCGICVPDCPIDAIKPDTEPGMEFWVEVNQKHAKIWPNITQQKSAPIDAEQWENIAEKYKNHFSPKPGKGDE